MLDLFSVYWLGLIIDKQCNKLEAAGAPLGVVKELRIKLWTIHVFCVALWFSSIFVCGVGFGPSLLYKNGLDIFSAVIKVFAVMFLVCLGPQGCITSIRQKVRDIPGDRSLCYKLFRILPWILGALALIVLVGVLLFFEYILFAIFVGPTVLLWATPGVVFMLICLFPFYAWLVCITTDSKGNMIWSQNCEVMNADAIKHRRSRLRKSSWLLYLALAVFALNNAPIFGVGSFFRLSPILSMGLMYALTVSIGVTVKRITCWASETIPGQNQELMNE